MSLTELELSQMLSEVARVENGPKVVFPHGYKIVEFEGEKVLQPLTPDEYRSKELARTGKEPSTERLAFPHCAIKGNTCISQGCNQVDGRCVIVGDLSGIYCICEY